MSNEPLLKLKELINYAYHACRSAQSYGNSYHVGRAEDALKKALDLCESTPPPATMKCPYKKEHLTIEKCGYDQYVNGWNACLEACKELNAPNVDKNTHVYGSGDKDEACEHIYESDCHGIEMIKSPSGKEWAIGGTNTKDRWLFDPWCGKKLRNVQPSEKKESVMDTCPDCQGKGNLKHSTNPALIGSILCWKCHGSGKVPKTSSIEVEDLAYELCKMLADDFHAETPEYFKTVAIHLINAGWSKKEGKDGLR